MRAARAASVLAVVLMGSVLTACGDETSVAYGHSLEPTSFQELARTKLPGGGRVAVGSPDGHRITVQWRDPDGTSWSAPRTVYTEPGLFTHDIGVSVAGNTVAIDPDYWTEKVLDDDYAPDHTAQVLCHRQKCTPGRRTTGSTLSSTNLNRTGTFASFDLGDQVLLWSSDDGFRTSTYAGLPDRAPVRLGPDDRFVAVVGIADGDLCRYELYVTRPRTTSFTKAAETHPAGGDTDCSTASTEVKGRTVTVSVEATGADFSFVASEEGAAWEVDEPDLTLQAVADTGGRRTLATARMSLTDGTEVAISSPDLVRIVVQARAVGADAWTAPRVLARAPAGTRCRLQSTERTRPGGVSMVSCYPAARAWKVESTGATAGIALATEDGRTWAVAVVRDPVLEPVIGPDGTSLMAGREAQYLWRAGDRSFTRLPLGQDPEWDGVTFDPRGTSLIGITGNGDPQGRCRPRLRTAALDGTGWRPGEQVTLPDDFPARGTCSARIYYYGDNDTEGTVSAESHSWQFVLERTTTGWRARPAG